MFPIVRLLKDLFVASRMEPLPLTAVHRSSHICWPWDLDIWLELNNGRAMTLYDLGRTMLAQRVGLIGALRQNRWGMTVAGTSVRFRRRIRGFERFEMRSRAVAWDDKFIYLEQSMWKKNGECASHVMLRTAVTDAKGIVPPTKVLAAVGQGDAETPTMPEWIAAWCQADATRPWPPMAETQDGLAS
ncbi:MULTISPECIES: acyl-CoA thioesterase [Rhodobacterales]|jgi:acyl-CoA thioesterase FadM|uniref:acyl-CoA thioesterase n=1 Tax=Rhodobacterales TaxID=204455 RepID=UPI00237F1EE0|nr:acyl-CoA thioesterase [Phaeobacter gallaeciensis]MEC9313176.1 acyl-CoA thioesterase [Pseudomonadota bacterium]MDE4141197.1 acyl-CoA thioesterase [Phaeobacter gallaeciensis]MDE4149642.1 acyl-CoA thioesterase [Phaeobacter gallaeciensis]MDE4153908.1 acyl-CoA thioesterase [Phaeobacter gallaeciensis]MDE4229299.1 acyl-CoA thioesterase [Phaeobacter gallaeciensis]